MMQFDEKNDLNLIAFYFLSINLMVSLVLTIIVCCAKKKDTNIEGNVEAQLPSEKASNKKNQSREIDENRQPKKPSTNHYIETIPNESPPKPIESSKPKEPINFAKSHDYQTLMGLNGMNRTVTNKPKP